jgi:hypothetical protein
MRPSAADAGMIKEKLYFLLQNTWGILFCEKHK